jgi:hypothetical protein
MRDIYCGSATFPYEGLERRQAQETSVRRDTLYENSFGGTGYSACILKVLQASKYKTVSSSKKGHAPYFAMLRDGLPDRCGSSICIDPAYNNFIFLCVNQLFWKHPWMKTQHVSNETWPRNENDTALYLTVRSYRTCLLRTHYRNILS